MKQSTKLLKTAGFLFLAGLFSGCAALTSPEAQTIVADQTRKLACTDRLEDRIAALEEQERMVYAYVVLSAKKAGITETDARDWLDGRPTDAEEEPVVQEADVDAIDFASFQWSFGGFNGSKATLSSPRLSGLKAGNSSISYKWDEGLSGWGLADGDASALACLFVTKSDGSVVGGKFDWVSTSRKTRGLENVFSGYNGWSLKDVPNPTTIYYVVVSKDGKKRSNIVSAEWKR